MTTQAMFCKMKLGRVIMILVLILVLNTLSVCNCELFEFEDFVEPDGPWGRQPIIRGEDGGYSNILIAVHPDVDDDQAVLDRIKGSLNETSHRLHDASDQILYLKEVTILVPDQWGERPEYLTPRPNETVQTARVIIRNGASAGRPPTTSFVRHPGVCGEEGEFIYLPTGALPRDNVPATLQVELADELIQLWSQLRWGVEQHPSPTGSHVPSYCLSSAVNWTELASADDDFQRLVRPDQAEVTPSYRVVKRSELLSVVILDARQNMRNDGKFTRMIEMYKHYVWHLFPTYSRLGVIAMNNNTISQIHPFTKLWEFDSFRSQLQKMLPAEANGTTSLGNAVIASIQLLRTQRRNVQGMPVFIMSDGTETISPTLIDVQNNITEAGVIVTSLPFSSNKSENIELNNTINENFTVSAMDRLTRLGNRNRFIRIIETDVIRMEEYLVHDFPVLFTDRGYRVARTLIRLRADDFMELNITYYASKMDLLSASGRPVEWIWDSSWIHVNGTTDVVDIYDKVYQLEILSFITQNVSFEVFAILFDTASNTAYVNEMLQARTIVESPVHDFASLMSGVPIFTIVTKNQVAVIHSAVRTSITRPDGTLISMELSDTGQEYDAVANDGIYSGLFSEITVEGDYRIKTEVDGSGSFLKRAFGAQPLSPFLRAPPERVFTVYGIPPGSVSDLIVEAISGRTVRLTWTAPGGDSVYGRAHHYQLRYSLVVGDLLDHLEDAANVTDVLEGDLTFPGIASTTEHFNISFEDVLGNPFYMAVRAVDDGGKKGNISNVIEVYVTDFVTTTVDSHIGMTTAPAVFDTTTDVTTSVATTKTLTTPRISTKTFGDTASITTVPTTPSIPLSTPAEPSSTRGVTEELSSTTHTASSREPDYTRTTKSELTKQTKKKNPDPTKRTLHIPVCPKSRADCKITETNDSKGNTFRETLMIVITTDEAFPAYVITFLLICTATTVLIIVFIYRRRKKRREAREMHGSPEEIELVK